MTVCKKAETFSRLGKGTIAQTTPLSEVMEADEPVIASKQRDPQLDGGAKFPAQFATTAAVPAEPLATL